MSLITLDPKGVQLGRKKLLYLDLPKKNRISETLYVVLHESERVELKFIFYEIKFKSLLCIELKKFKSNILLNKICYFSSNS